MARSWKRVRVGWESYGTLDRDRSNAILVTHYFWPQATQLAAMPRLASCQAYWDSDHPVTQGNRKLIIAMAPGTVCPRFMRSRSLPGRAV